LNHVHRRPLVAIPHLKREMEKNLGHHPCSKHELRLEQCDGEGLHFHCNSVSPFPPTAPPLLTWPAQPNQRDGGGDCGSNARRRGSFAHHHLFLIQMQDRGVFLATTTVRLTPPPPLNTHHPSSARIRDGGVLLPTNILLSAHTTPPSLEMQNGGAFFWPPPPSTSIAQNLRGKVFVAHHHPPFDTSFNPPHPSLFRPPHPLFDTHHPSITFSATTTH